MKTKYCESFSTLSKDIKNSFNHLQCRGKPALPTIHSWLFKHPERPQKALFDTAFILTLQEPTRVNNWCALILSKLSAETKLTCDNNEYINRVKRVTNMFMYRRITLKIYQSRNTRLKIKAKGFVSQLTLCLQLSTVIDALYGRKAGTINLHFSFSVLSLIIVPSPFATLEPRRRLGRANFRKDFWDLY